MSQNRPVEDRVGAAAGLEARGQTRSGTADPSSFAARRRGRVNNADAIRTHRRGDRIRRDLLQCISPLVALRSYAETDAQRPLLEVRADSHVGMR